MDCRIISFVTDNIVRGGANIITHPRNIEDSVRRKESKRQRERERKKAKKEAKKKEKLEELARQRNKKLKDIKSRLKEIQEITGTDSEYHASIRLQSSNPDH